MSETKLGGGEIHGCLGKGTTLMGELHLEDAFRIDGRVSGRIVSDDLLIVGEGANVSADIEVGSMAVLGRVTGSVRARHGIEVHAGGRLEADIVTPSLNLAEGAFFQGFCDMGRPEPVGECEETSEFAQVAEVAGG